MASYDKQYLEFQIITFCLAYFKYNNEWMKPKLNGHQGIMYYFYCFFKVYYLIIVIFKSL